MSVSSNQQNLSNGLTRPIGFYNDRLRKAILLFDHTIDKQFDKVRGRKPADLVFYAASEIADFSVLWHIINLATLAVRPSKRREAVRLAVALGAESILVNGILKRIFKRERPPLLDERVYDVRRPKTTSFPSGHASSASLAAVLLSASMPKAKKLWWFLALVVATSRIHNRMHHPSDVAAGAIGGTAMGLAAKRFR